MACTFLKEPWGLHFFVLWAALFSLVTLWGGWRRLGLTHRNPPPPSRPWAREKGLNQGFMERKRGADPPIDEEPDFCPEWGKPSWHHSELLGDGFKVHFPHRIEIRVLDCSTSPKMTNEQAPGLGSVSVGGIGKCTGDRRSGGKKCATGCG